MAFVKDYQGTVSQVFSNTIKLKSKESYLINVGSVGQPRDDDPRASYGIFNVNTRTVKLYRVNYDIAGACQKMKQAGLPIRNALRLSKGR